jgi:hypothetical protein
VLDMAGARYPAVPRSPHCLPRRRALLRRPSCLVQTDGFEIEDGERFSFGVVERLAARCVGRRLPRYLARSWSPNPVLGDRIERRPALTAPRPPADASIRAR